MKTIQILSVCLLTLAVGSIGFAQNDAGAKIRGDAWNGGQARTYQNHARDYSRMLYYQGQVQEKIQPAQAKQFVGSIKQNVESANKALDQVQAAHSKDEAVKKSVEKIKKLHEQVLAHCEMMDGELKKEGVSSAVLCDCCVDVEKTLDEASAETDKVLKHLKIDKLPTLKKSTEKKADDKKPTEKKGEK